MPRTAEATWGFRLQPREWPRLAREIREDPGDVAVGARFFFSVGGHDEEPTWWRFVRTPEGARMVREETGYPALFTDYEQLRALPPGTLGREYVRDRVRDARYLAAVEDWDRLLRLPLEEARAELGISPPQPYRTLALGEVFASAAESAS